MARQDQPETLAPATDAQSAADGLSKRKRKAKDAWSVSKKTKKSTAATTVTDAAAAATSASIDADDTKPTATDKAAQSESATDLVDPVTGENVTLRASKQRQAQADAQAAKTAAGKGNKRYTLFVGNLSYATTAADLEALILPLCGGAAPAKPDDEKSGAGTGTEGDAADGAVAATADHDDATTDGADKKKTKKKPKSSKAKKPTTAADLGVQVRLATDPRTGKSKGFCFVDVPDRQALDKVLMLHHAPVRGRKINVELTAGGGGAGTKRMAKIAKKNAGLEEERAKQRKDKADLLAAKQARRVAAGCGKKGNEGEGVAEQVDPEMADINPERRRMLGL